MNELEKIMQINNRIGICTDSNNHIIDQDSCTVLKYKGKDLKFGSNQINYRTEMFYNPYEDEGLLKYLFYYYLNKLEVLEGKYYPVNYQLYDANKNVAIVLKDNEGKIITSNYNQKLADSLLDLMSKID